MYHLGINKGLNASAVLMKDNRVIFGVQEERLSREKNQPGFPKLAIDAALKFAGISIDEIERICVSERSSKIPASRQDDLQKFHNRYGKIKKKWFGEEESAIANFAQRGLRKIGEALRGSATDEPSRERTLTDHLADYGAEAKLRQYDHHLCHAASAYYGLTKKPNEQVLVFSMDGGGDGRTSAVFVGENGVLREIASSDSFSPACIYAHITYIMGFLPHEHEYKLMGLAPYAQPKYAEIARDTLAKFVDFDTANPLILTNGEKYAGVRNSQGDEKQILVEDLFKSVLNFRFDTLAAGLQKLAEETAVRWIKAGVERTGIRRILLTGGFFMNVKANQLIAELPEVEFVNAFPSCGDETNAFGAAFLGYQEACGAGAAPIEFADFCLGPEATIDLDEAKVRYRDQVEFRRSDSINSEFVRMLKERKIVARCSGRMEFGARALGNRSILASPDDIRIIQTINAAIKKRDFWMPFAPAILEEHADTVLDIPPSLREMMSPYMMFTFPAKAAAYNSLIAGIHQADKTARGQLIGREIYPEFHDIATRFHAETGIPAVLNTSFNLHGYPIVLGAVDAIDVYLNSELDVLVVGDWIITRKK